MNHSVNHQELELNHFLEAQEEVWPEVLLELRNGKKETHWMWFVFPQLLGLGRSPTSIKFAIKNNEHAKAYWNHPILGARLRECFDLVEKSGKKPVEIFDGIDALKYQSCKKLFKQFNNI
jgi:hypothetical protein